MPSARFQSERLKNTKNINFSNWNFADSIKILNGIPIEFEFWCKEQLTLPISPTLQMLHLVDCGKLTSGSIQHIVKNCVNLTEMNLTLTYLSEDSVKFLASNLTTKIEKLSLGQLESVKDEHVKTLVKR